MIGTGLINSRGFTRYPVNAYLIEHMENEIYIRELLVKEHFGLITEEEQLQLDAILAVSTEAQALREEIRSLPKDEALAHMERMDDSAGMQELLRLHQHRRTRRTRALRIIAACITAGIAITGIYLLQSPRTPENTAAITIDGGATLQLANGQIIRMQDSGLQSVTADDATLNNENRVLSIAAKGTAAEGWNTLTVPPKLDYRLVLSDGTKVWLNSTSKIRFPFAFTGQYREVYIEGEAYFEVQQDAGKPFMVHAGQADVLVLGTAFNVNAYTPTRVITSLVSGKVSINEQVLQPGREAIVATGEPVTIRDFDAATSLSWREGIHHFRNSSIRDIAAVINRWYDVELVIDNPGAAALQMRARLIRNEPLQTFIDKLNATGVVHFYWQGKVLHCK